MATEREPIRDSRAATPAQEPTTAYAQAERPQPGGDPIRWGAVWAGLLVALGTYVLVELALFAGGLLTLDLDPTGSSQTAGWISALVALFSFFVGGLVTGLTGTWRRRGDGLLNGVVLWALGIVAILSLTAFGGGALLGSVAEVANRLNAAQFPGAAPNLNVQQAFDVARDVAGWSVLFLVLALVAAAIGGAAGARARSRGLSATSPR
jgi:cation transport ATPase